MKPRLSGPRQRTYDCVFRHPANHNLGWLDLRSIMGIASKCQPLAKAHDGNASPTLVRHPSPRSGPNQ